jgi:hypothetical protein
MDVSGDLKATTCKIARKSGERLDLEQYGASRASRIVANVRLWAAAAGAARPQARRFHYEGCQKHLPGRNMRLRATKAPG